MPSDSIAYDAQRLRSREIVRRHLRDALLELAAGDSPLAGPGGIEPILDAVMGALESPDIGPELAYFAGVMFSPDLMEVLRDRVQSPAPQPPPVGAAREDRRGV